MPTVYHPKSIHVRIASGCNLGCSFCERELLPKSPGGKAKSSNVTFIDGRAELDLTKDMNLETWRLVSSKFLPHFDNIELGGLGEPTLGKIFTVAAKEVVDAGKNLFFFTNGHFLDRKEVIDAVGPRPRISLSIDAGTEEGYKRIRKGELSKLVASVKGFKEKVPGAKIDSQFTMVAGNIDELEPFVRLCAELGIGRHSAGEMILINAADHHVTDRVQDSVRFRASRTRAAVAKASQIASEAGLWLISNLPPFSEDNPDAGDDDSDPGGFRRWADVPLYGSNPCATSTDSATISENSELQTGTLEEPPEAARPYGDAGPDPTPAEIKIAPKELYVDYDGALWSCLARHEIGHVKTDTFKTAVERNEDYQEFLAAWFYGTAINDKRFECKSCPRRK